MNVGLISPPEEGQLVSVRSRHWVVNDVEASALAPSPLKPSTAPRQHLVTLTSIEDDALGEELQVFWELEPGTRKLEKVDLPEASGFDKPDRLDAFLDAVRWGAASTADVKNIQAPFRAGIEIEDYQLDPVVRAIQMPRVNLLIADDVGLGKTIEAGLVALELILRHRARRVLVLCPASLQVQWRDQMRDKFGLDFRIVDSELMRDLRRKRGINVNPWGHFPRLITSIDFLKRERPLRLFKETLPQEGQSLYPRRYDILILDESHNCAHRDGVSMPPTPSEPRRCGSSFPTSSTSCSCRRPRTTATPRASQLCWNSWTISGSPATRRPTASNLRRSWCGGSRVSCPPSSTASRGSRAKARYSRSPVHRRGESRRLEPQALLGAATQGRGGQRREVRH